MSPMDSLCTKSVSPIAKLWAHSTLFFEYFKIITSPGIRKNEILNPTETLWISEAGLEGNKNTDLLNLRMKVSHTCPDVKYWSGSMLYHPDTHEWL